jgi:hypothetical protein
LGGARLIDANMSQSLLVALAVRQRAKHPVYVRYRTDLGAMNANTSPYGLGE